eukprot:5761134-Prymnesium_polylepis.1
MTSHTRSSVAAGSTLTKRQRNHWVDTNSSGTPSSVKCACTCGEISLTNDEKTVLAEHRQHPEGGLVVKLQRDQQHARNVVERLAVADGRVAQRVGRQDVAQLFAPLAALVEGAVVGERAVQVLLDLGARGAAVTRRDRQQVCVQRRLLVPPRHRAGELQPQRDATPPITRLRLQRRTHKWERGLIRSGARYLKPQLEAHMVRHATAHESLHLLVARHALPRRPRVGAFGGYGRGGRRLRRSVLGEMVRPLLELHALGGIRDERPLREGRRLGDRQHKAVLIEPAPTGEARASARARTHTAHAVSQPARVRMN